MMVTMLQSTNQVETFSAMRAVISAPVGRRDVYGRMLARELEGQLSAIVVLAPAAPWRPWADDRDLHGRPGQPFLALRSPAHQVEARDQIAARRRLDARRQVASRNGPPRPPPGPTERRSSRRDGGGPDVA